MWNFSKKLVDKCSSDRMSVSRFFSEKQKSIEFTSLGAKSVPNTSKPVVKPLNIRFYSWWSTPRGQKCAGLGLVCCAGLSAFFQIAPHTFMMNFVRDFYQHITFGQPTQIRAEMKKLLSEVVADLQLTKEEVEAISFFVMNMGDSCSWGDAARSLVGYPYYFHFRKPQEVPLTRKNFGNKGSSYTKFLSPAELESAEAKQLAEGLVLSEDAKKFALAREILKTRQAQQYKHAATSASFILLTLFSCRIINTKLNLFRKPPLLRGLNYLTVSSTMTLTFFQTKDSVNRRQQGYVDTEASKLSREYARGGVEFYSKILARHTAQRVLCLDGTKLYNLNGEEVYEYIRRRNKQFTERRETCQTVLNEYK